jgi:hypothetical protein
MTIPVGGPWDPEQHMFVGRPLSAWVEQAEDALTAIRAANGGADLLVTEAATIAPGPFASLIEAMVALEPVTGMKVEGDLIRRAGLVPVDQALME